MWTPRIYLWLETVIDFLYIVYVSPFKLVYNHKNDSYVLYTTSLHKFLPALIHTIGVLYTFFGIYSSATHLSLQNPRCIFHSAVEYSRFIIYYSLLLSLWTRSSHFNSFFTSAPEISSSDGNENKAKIFTWLICILMVPASVTIEIIAHVSFSSGLSEYINHSYGKGAGNLLQVFGLRNYGTAGIQLSNVTVTGPTSEFEYGFTVFYNLIAIYLRLCNHVSVLFCIFAAVTMAQGAAAFVTQVSSERDQEKVIEKYIDFCKFGSALNRMCGYVVLGVIVCSPPFFVVYFIGTFTNWEYTGPRIIFYSCLYCFLYVIAAEAASKIGEFKEWIIEYGEGDNESQLFAMFVEISQNPMGLRGLECFTITYGFLSKMFAIVVTFTIILLQFETTPDSPMTRSACE